MRIAFPGPEEHRALYDFDIGRYYLYICIVMSDLLKSIWEFLGFVWDYLNTLTPLQTLICIAWAAVCVLLVACAVQLGSFNPKHYPDEYVKSHMHVFHSWFVNHPEDKARYV